MKLIIKEKKELLDIEDFEIRAEVINSFFLFELLAFDFNNFKMNKRTSKENTIRTLNEFCSSAIEISELFFYLLWKETEQDYQNEEDMPVPSGVCEKLTDFTWMFEGRPILENCGGRELQAFQESFSETLDMFTEIQEVFSFACKFCFDVDYADYPVDGLTTEQRWYILSKSAEYTEPRAFIEQFAEISENTSVVQPGELFYSDSLLHADTDELSKYIDEPLGITELIEKYRGIRLEPLRVYETDSLFGLVYAEFWDMVISSTRIKKCRYCGKYFIPFSENSEYCSRVFKDKGKSCKDYAPMVLHREKIRGNNLLSIYKKADAAHYMRYKRNPMLHTQEKYETWRVMATEALARAEREEISAEELKAMLKK